ncbi:hypothetical protein EVAR_21562_1 [Eumeta japonica]|uniref:Uncharacterized protein n=1 Tax=Eumeta variegata TaxID=151549 RepID=A0A4C1XNU8_EUMVA|nr:hypothetical protein EVAR_21562_1 [Eumeta japonica]
MPTFVFEFSLVLKFGSGLSFDYDSGPVLSSALRPALNFDSVINHSPDFKEAGISINIQQILFEDSVAFYESFGGSLSFDHHSHDWEAFKVRLTQFCVANGVTDENDKISGVGALFSLRRSPKTQCEWRQVW